MNVPAALLVESIPFAGLFMATSDATADLFVILYIVAFGLLMSLIALSGDHGALVQTLVVIGQFD